MIFFFFFITDNVKRIEIVVGNKAEIPCNDQKVKNSTEWPVLIIWYRGQDFPIYRYVQYF